MPGDIFFESYSPHIYSTNKTKGYNCFRIGFGRVSDEDIEKGIKIIGKNIDLLKNLSTMNNAL